MKQKYIDYFMSVARLTANLSYANRLKVGTVIVKDNRIISCGYNGMPSGWNNKCEYEIVLTPEEFYNLNSYSERSRYIKTSKYIDSNTEIECFIGEKTFDEVIHSEANAISRLAKSTESGDGAVLFCTHSPCIQCSKIIYGAGITSVYYDDEYRSTQGLEFLTKSGISVFKYKG